MKPHRRNRPPRISMQRINHHGRHYNTTLSLFLLFTLTITNTIVTSLSPSTTTATTNNKNDDDDCADGICPTALSSSSPPTCSLWLSPSPIKHRENHGFGLSLFTGRNIPAGTVFTRELLLPLYDHDYHNIEEVHPPLREFTWNGLTLPPLLLESYYNMIFFMSGLSAMAPCTSKNFNMEQVHRIAEDNGGVNRHQDPTAGSFAYLGDSMWTAVRDIVAGEELVVECTDDDFDGGVYELQEYEKERRKRERFDNAVACLDGVMVGQSTIEKVGKGLFATTSFRRGEVVLATPVVPIHRRLLRRNETGWLGGDNNDVNWNFQGREDLLVNYCFGHSQSNLLLLPYGPMVNYINHDLEKSNAFIRWHESGFGSDELPRRQQHHHSELFNMTAFQVAETHGKGLLIDVIASRDIAEGEEIFLDYGMEWAAAWKQHVGQFHKKTTTTTTTTTETFQSASDYVTANYQKEDFIRTVTQQHHDPYPSHLQTACHYTFDWVDPETDEEGVTYASWDDYEEHFCLLPCLILSSEDVVDEDDAPRRVYTAKLIDVAHLYHQDISWDCHLLKEYEYIYTDIPAEGITLVNKPFATDAQWDGAFRHVMGVPEGFYPQAWLRQKVRRGRKTTEQKEKDDGKEFTRKREKVTGRGSKMTKEEFIQFRMEEKKKQMEDGGSSSESTTTTTTTT